MEYFDLDSLDIGHDILERTNPVFNTAKMTLFQLSAAGDTDAANVAQQLGLTRDETQNSDNFKADDDQFLCGQIVLETRYRTMAALAEASGCGTEVDLPCGYTPRAVQFSRKGLPFVGLDLPAVTEEAETAILPLVSKDKAGLVKFRGCDATNYSSLRKALSDTEGSLCITTEGLLMYFTDSEAGALCDNIRRLLEDHGGCWLIADIEASVQYILTLRALCGDRFKEILENSKKISEEKSDVAIGGSKLIISPGAGAEEGIREAMAFLSRRGLKAERMIIGEHLPELMSLNNVSPEKADAIRSALMQCAYWKVTLADDTMKLDTSDTKAEDFDIDASFSGNGLLLKVNGRVDSISAPKLLAFYEGVILQMEISSVRIDCGDLAYISSAGLRVLMIMRKSCKQGVTLTQVSPDILEILEQTGFDSVLEIE